MARTARVATSPSTIPTLLDTEHRGWKLQVRLLRCLLTGVDGWVCYATRPSSSQELNLGRWSDSDLALEHGRAYIDRRLDEPSLAGPRPSILKRRQ